MSCHIIVNCTLKKNTYTSEIDKTFMEMVQYQIVLFLVKKSLECSIYDQKWVILGPSVQKSINK